MTKIFLNDHKGFDLSKLLDSKLLIQANSGGGKSWAIRRVLEQSHGKVQHIIIDLEGEFKTLREKYDYVLFGKDGDFPLSLKTAGMLARKILELEFSAILDLSEMHAHERKPFVRLFLESMMDLPKKKWHSCLVVIDEAHQFAPEKDKSEAAGAVIDLCSRGRKRGYCAILATQRISKLAKDAAAECNNKMIGRTGLDVDMKRASDELGFSTRDDFMSLRRLEAGEFFVFGPAISNEVMSLKVGGVETTHPRAGARIKARRIPPTKKIRDVLKKITDLPKEAEEEAKSIADLKQENANLKRENTIMKRTPVKEIQTKVETKIVEKPVLKDGQIKRLELVFERMVKEAERHGSAISLLWDNFDEIGKAMIAALLSIKNAPIQKPIAVPEKIDTVRHVVEKKVEKVADVQSNEVSEKPITGGAMRILEVLVSRYPMQFTRSQLATFSKLKASSGTYGNYLSILRGNGMIEESSGLLSASQKALDEMGSLRGSAPQSREDLIELWRSNLSGGALRMFNVLVHHHPRKFTKEDLGGAASLSWGSGTFGNYMSILRTNGLITERNGLVGLSEVFDL